MQSPRVVQFMHIGGNPELVSIVNRDPPREVAVANERSIIERLKSSERLSIGCPRGSTSQVLENPFMNLPSGIKLGRWSRIFRRLQNRMP
jgi:hypothetical protein